VNPRCKRNTKTVTVAKALAIAKLSHLPTDGTKTKAKASNNNLQITVDHDSGIIAANDVTPDCTDPAQLEPQVNSMMENVGKLPESAEVGFENGYFSAPNLRYL